MKKPLDPEIKAMRAIARELRKFDDDAIRRMLEFFWSKFVVSK